MKKITTYTLVILLLLSTISPAFATDSGYAIDVSLNQPFYAYGDTLSFNGNVTNGLQGVDSAAITVKVEYEATGQKIYVDQFTTDLNGAFSGGFTISEGTAQGKYALTLTALGVVKTETFIITSFIPVIQMDIGGITFMPSDIMSISGLLTIKGVPQMNADVTLEVVDKDTESLIISLGVVKTNTEGKFFSNYRIPSSAVNKSFAILASYSNQKLGVYYSVVPRPVGPPVGPPVNPPSDTGSTTPVTPTTTEVAVEILEEEGIPLGAALENVGKNASGDKTVEVILDPVELDTAIANDASDKIVVTIKESGIKELYVIIPTKQLLAAGKAQKTIEFVSDDIEFTLDPNCLSVVTGKDAVLAFKMQNPDGLYTLAESLDMNQVSDGYGFSVYYKDTLKAIKILKPILIGLQYAPSMVTNHQRLGMYVFDETSKKYNYIGGKTLTEFPMLYASVKESSTLSVMEFNMQFSDLPTTHWSYNQVNTLVSKHIINGIGNREFKGERQISRAEFIAMLVNAVEMTSGTTPVSITDISGAWYTELVKIAASNGIISATDTFRPNDTMTREEMALALANVIKLYKDTSAVTLDALAAFSDSALLDTSVQMDIAIVTDYELFSGIDGTFAPKGMATRAQAAAVVYKLLIVLDLL